MKEKRSAIYSPTRLMKTEMTTTIVESRRSRTKTLSDSKRKTIAGKTIEGKKRRTAPTTMTGKTTVGNRLLRHQVFVMLD
jgi:hypothetical protein